MTTSVEDGLRHLTVKDGSYLESFIKSKCRLSKKFPNIYIPLSRTTFDDEFCLRNGRGRQERQE